MTGVVIDASIAIKWVVDEEGSDDAVRLIDGPALCAPDLLMSECVNILWKKTRRGELTRDEASLAIDLLARADIELVPTRPLASAATVLALDLDHPAYDCMYLALAIERGEAFITADRRFAHLVAARAEPGLAGKVVELHDVDKFILSRGRR